MNFIETIYNKIVSMKKNKFDLRDVARHTGLQYGFDKKALEQTLKALVKQGKLKELKDGYFSVVQEIEIKECIIFGTSKDYAFALLSSFIPYLISAICIPYFT